MDQRKNSSDPQFFPGSIPMARIDGGKIRRLREKKGLTQLYLSTVVGVTTDTISRWENRRYQSVKLENAEKLAQALEVGLADILEQQDQDEPEAIPPLAGPQPKASPRPDTRTKQIIIAAVILTLLAAAGIVSLILFPELPDSTVTAERILPPHVPAGQKFPVLIRVRSLNQDTVSLIISETVPPGSKALQGSPPITTVDRRDNSLKWIGRTEPLDSVYAYMCQAPSDAHQAELLPFSGTVTLKLKSGDHEAIRGASSLTVAPYHWADINRDNMIDDEEILAVYDLYNDIKELEFDRDLIDNIWAGSGYRWNEEQKKYLVSQ